MDLEVMRKMDHGAQDHQDLGPGYPVLCGDQVGMVSGSCPQAWPCRPSVAHMVVVFPAPLWPRKEVICPS